MLKRSQSLFKYELVKVLKNKISSREFKGLRKYDLEMLKAEFTKKERKHLIFNYYYSLSRFKKVRWTYYDRITGRFTKTRVARYIRHEGYYNWLIRNIQKKKGLSRSKAIKWFKHLHSIRGMQYIRRYYGKS
jgi:hypothetical protein